jgi:hypothetical protein
MCGALVCLIACGANSSKPPSTADAGSEAGSGGDGGAGSTKACPNGDLPNPTLALGCPTSIPDAGSCCAQVGQSCPYPGDTVSHPVALCIDDSVHAPYWGQTDMLDRLVCTFSGMVSPLGMGAGACSERKVEPCGARDLLTPQTLLQSQFSAIVDGCGGLTDESSLQVEFRGGCATRLSASLSGAADHADMLSCVGKALDALHFACADDLDCARVHHSTLAP